MWRARPPRARAPQVPNRNLQGCHTPETSSARRFGSVHVRTCAHAQRICTGIVFDVRPVHVTRTPGRPDVHTCAHVPYSGMRCSHSVMLPSADRFQPRLTGKMGGPNRPQQARASPGVAYRPRARAIGRARHGSITSRHARSWRMTPLQVPSEEPAAHVHAYETVLNESTNSFGLTELVRSVF